MADSQPGLLIAREPAMITQDQLEALRGQRQEALNRLLLLARRNFILRVGEIQEAQRIPPMPPAALALLPFIELEGSRGSSLAEKAGISKQAAGKGIKAMEAMGLVRRQADRSDARAWRICFTKKGIDYMNRALQTIEQAEREVAARIGEQQLELLKHLLYRLAYGEERTPPQPVAAEQKRKKPSAG